MRILVIGRGIPTKTDPMRGCFEITQAKALAKLGHEVYYCCVDMGDTRTKSPITILNRMGLEKKKEDEITIYRLGFLPRGGWYLFGEKVCRWIVTGQFEYLFNLIQKKHGNIDVVYSHYLFITHFITPITQRFRIPLVAIEHWSELAKDPLDSRTIKYGKLNYPKVDKLICVSSALANSIKKNFGIESVVIPNMVEDNFFIEDEDIKVLGPKPIEIVSIGRFATPKKHADLVKACSKLQFPRENWHLSFVGDGYLLPEIKQLVKDLGLDDNISFLGQLPRDEVRETLANCDFFALASSWETFGVVFIEALAMGKPVIGTRCGGPEEIIDSSNGLLVDPHNVEELSNAIEWMLNNYMKFDSSTIKKQTKECYSSHYVAKRIESILQKAFNDKNN